MMDIKEQSVSPSRLPLSVGERAAELFSGEHVESAKRTDKVFALLLLGQWTAATAYASYISQHVAVAFFVGGAITGVPVILAFVRPGNQSTRHVLACGQVLWSALLIHLAGGRIEAHFHVFASLAFVALYRDAKVLMTATAIVGADHLFRGIYWPESLYGLSNSDGWRLMQHLSWVALFDLLLLGGLRSAGSAQQRLCEQQAQLEEDRHLETFRFMEQLPLGIYIVDATGTPVYANDTAKSLLGEGVIGDGGVAELCDAYPMYLRGTDTVLPDEKNPLAKALSGEVSGGELVEVQRPDGRIHLCFRAAPIRNASGEIAFGLGAIEDISDRVRADIERLQGQKLESVGQLAAGVAHEINTPMQYIGDNAHFLEKALGNVIEMLEFYEQLVEGSDAAQSANAKAKRLKLDFLKPRIPRAARSTIEGVESVSEIVRALREFSHPGSGEKVLTDINQAIETTISVSRNEWKYAAELETNFDDALPLVPCLTGELNQVVLNMIVNAAHAIGDKHEEAMEPQGHIKIATRHIDAHAEITIGDSGSGMDASVKEKIFDPFFTTKGVGKGTGQGLAIARSIIVEKHGGSIQVESEVGLGTTFTIRLPLEIEEQMQGAA